MLKHWSSLKKKETVIRQHFIYAAKELDRNPLMGSLKCLSIFKQIFPFRDRPQRLRDDTLRDFRNKRFNVLVATDVCARGLDIKNLDHVIA